MILIFLGHSGASKSVIRSEIRRARAGGFWREKRQAGGGARGGAQACGEAVGTFTADPPVLRDCWVLLLTSTQISDDVLQNIERQANARWKNQLAVDDVHPGCEWYLFSVHV